MIKTQDHIRWMEEVARRYSPKNFDGIEVVANIKDAAKAHRLHINNPRTPAACLKNSKNGNFKILFLSEISVDDVVSVKQGMEYTGFDKEIELLINDHDFLTHTLLHEISEGINPSFGEADHDQWAFNQLKNV